LIVSQNIIEACKKNDRSSQKIIYEKFFDRMFAVCRRYVRSEEETLEVLNDGFMSVFQNIGHFKGEGSFEGWIRKIIVNKALDHLRANKKYKETLQYVEDYKEEPSFVDAEIISSCNIDELYDLVQKLPAVYRMVFNLYTIEGFSHKEIAEKIGISETTSRWYLSESRKKLKEKLTVTIYQL
jgi:RNA polymerase sigma factor (sigma-70 family)